jgi:hypothetical protein
MSRSLSRLSAPRPDFALIMSSALRCTRRASGRAPSYLAGMRSLARSCTSARTRALLCALLPRRVTCQASRVLRGGNYAQTAQ